jgi:hypothetical protein
MDKARLIAVALLDAAILASCVPPEKAVAKQQTDSDYHLFDVRVDVVSYGSV